jgi:hypothetical protein
VSSVGMRKRPLAWVALCTALAYAGLALASGFDRIAAAAPAAAALVPGALQTGALTGLLRGQGSAPQLALAERLVARAPARAEAVSLLGTARLATGDPEGADRAFRVAALYGWRDAPTQLYWLQTALGAERYDLAALRFDALARQWPTAPAVAQAAAAFDTTAEGRAALTERIVAGAAWARVYALANEGEDAAALGRRAEVLLAAGRGGRKLGCTDIARTVSSLAAIDIGAAAALWRAHCPDAAPHGAVSDGGFERISAQAPLTSFEWELPGDGALSTFAVMQGAVDCQHLGFDAAICAAADSARAGPLSAELEQRCGRCSRRSATSGKPLMQDRTPEFRIACRATGRWQTGN